MPIGVFRSAVTILYCIIPIAAFASPFDPNAYPGLEDVSNLPNVVLDFRYATSDNFLGRPVYGSFKRCYLQKIAADKLKHAAEELQKQKSGWKLLVFDCLRPRSIQREMWSVVKGTSKQKYVANPDTGSMHNFGFAVDLSLLDDQGREVDMGTPFDYFGPEAEPEKEVQFLKEGRLTQQEIANRKLLRQIMSEGGFMPLPIEWWHFDALTKADVKANYKIIE